MGKGLSRATLVSLAWLLVAAGSGAAARADSPHVLLVCSGVGVTCPTGAASAQFTSIQAAVDHAQAGDWILIWPGDYREYANSTPEHAAGVWITTPNLFLRGMGRASDPFLRAVLDGTKQGPVCSDRKRDQYFGPPDPAHGNQPSGRDGIVVWKADGSWLENFTTCNFLTSASGQHGNQVWWNGGDGSGRIGLHSYWGDYLTATSTYSTSDSQYPGGGDNPRGEYGIFSSNTGNGDCSATEHSETTPTHNCYTGFMNHSYANNMGDAAFYIGACPDCTQVLENSRAEYSALGFSGTNAGGDFIIRGSEFDNNKTGLTSNSQNNDDQPSPQSGRCPPGESPPVAGAAGCTIFEFNRIHDNNNPNVPGVGQGLSGGAPVGTGIVLGGTRRVTLYANQVYGNKAWGALVSDEPDQESAPAGFPQCKGGVWYPALQLCWYQVWGNATLANTFSNNGGYGNFTNGDVALIEPPGGKPLPPPFSYVGNSPDNLNKPGNCFDANQNPGYGGDEVLKSDPPAWPASEIPSSALQDTPAPAGWGTCGYPPPKNSGNGDPVLIFEAACATQLLTPCPTGEGTPEASYGRYQRAILRTLVETEAVSPQMANPCGPDSWGEAPPPNPWCPAGSSSSSTSGGVLASSASPGLPGTGSRLAAAPAGAAFPAAAPALAPALIAFAPLLVPLRRRSKRSRWRSG